MSQRQTGYGVSCRSGMMVSDETQGVGMVGRKHRSLVVAVLFALLCLFYIYHFDFLKVPSADYIGNFRAFVLLFLKEGIGAVPNKVLPAYPVTLAWVTRLTGMYGFDAIYTNALLLNYVYFAIYLFSVWQVYREFFGRTLGFWALVALLLNSFSLYMVINAELEMFHGALSALTFALLIRNEKLAAFPAALTALVKWNSVCIVVAGMWRVFRQSASWLRGIVWGAVAGVPFAVWFVVKIIVPAGENTYIGEIARRGPNVYRFPVDAFLVLTGFLQWGAIDVYTGKVTVLTAGIVLLLLLFAVMIMFLFVTGLVSLIARRDSLTESLGIYTAGYFVVHMVYQNSKSRYALPLLWILHLIIFEGIRTVMEETRDRTKNSCAASLVKSDFFRYAAIAAAFVSAVLVAATGNVILFVFFIVLAVVLYGIISTYSVSVWVKVLSAALIVSFAGLNLAYGRSMLEHYSLRRVEFKRVSLYLNEHAKDEGKILVSERNVIRYYSDFPITRFIMTSSLDSETTDEVYDELIRKNVRFVYIDDFYIRRLKHNDKNAIERNAALLKELRAEAAMSDRYTLLTRIEVHGGITGFLYRVNYPE